MIKARFSKGISTQKAATILMDEIGMGREARQDPWESAALRETTTREESGQGMEADILPRPIMSGKDHKARLVPCQCRAFQTGLEQLSWLARHRY